MVYISIIYCGDLSLTSQRLDKKTLSTYLNHTITRIATLVIHY